MDISRMHVNLSRLFAVVLSVFILFAQPLTASAAYMGLLSNNQGFFNTSYTTTAVGDAVMPAAEACDFTYSGGTGWHTPSADSSSTKNSLPYNQVNTKSKFGSYLKSRYDGNRCAGWDRLGVTFVVHTMLGHAPGSARTLTAADWTEFNQKIINNSLVNMSYVAFSNSTLNSHSNGFKYYGSQEDMSFYSGVALAGPTILFTGPNAYRYELKLRCANPTGAMRTNVSVLPVWAISGSSSVSASTALPGDTVTWTHTVKNNGPDTTSSSITSSAYRDYTGTTTSSASTPAGVLSGNNVRQFSTSYNVTQADVGETKCQRVHWSPTNSSGGTNGRGTYACFTVPYDYRLQPSIAAPLSDIAEPSAEYEIFPSVRNFGPTKSESAEWQFIRLEVEPSYGLSHIGGGTSASATLPCSYHGGAGINCNLIDSGNEVFEVGLTDQPEIPKFDETVGDMPVGSKLCYGLSVRPRTQSDSSWQHSPLRCVVIGKKPKVQVWGGDASARGYINTSTSTKSGTTYGSWGEYGVLSVGTNSGMASGAGLNDGAASNNQSAWSRLTFANVTAPYGLYSSLSSRSLPAVADRLVNSSASSALPATVGDVNSLNGVYSRLGNVTISGGTLQSGKTVILEVTGTATINGSISYTNSVLSTINDIPQLVIIANNINIEDSVTNIDAWLVATGSGPTNGIINTCSNGPSDLTYLDCDNPLRVNGPVIANKLNLRRTAGSNVGVDSGVPAEVFNLRPDAYLWAQARAGGSGRAQTVMTTELAPRF